jgi:hypothetical protein
MKLGTRGGYAFPGVRLPMINTGAPIWRAVKAMYEASLLSMVSNRRPPHSLRNFR